MPHGNRTPELPKKSVNYHRELAEKGWRKGLKPLTVTQAEGPSFTVRCSHGSPTQHVITPASVTGSIQTGTRWVFTNLEWH
jgi:hypothetical protein